MSRDRGADMDYVLKGRLSSSTVALESPRTSDIQSLLGKSIHHATLAAVAEVVTSVPTERIPDLVTVLAAMDPMASHNRVRMSLILITVSSILLLGASASLLWLAGTSWWASVTVLATGGTFMGTAASLSTGGLARPEEVARHAQVIGKAIQGVRALRQEIEPQAQASDPGSS